MIPEKAFQGIPGRGRIQRCVRHLWNTPLHRQFPPAEGADDHTTTLPKEVVSHNSLLLTGGHSTIGTTHDNKEKEKGNSYASASLRSATPGGRGCEPQRGKFGHVSTNRSPTRGIHQHRRSKTCQNAAQAEMLSELFLTITTPPKPDRHPKSHRTSGNISCRIISVMSCFPRTCPGVRNMEILFYPYKWAFRGVTLAAFSLEKEKTSSFCPRVRPTSLV